MMNLSLVQTVCGNSRNTDAGYSHRETWRSLERFRLTFTRLLTGADQMRWTKTGVSKVRLSTDLGALLNEEILIYVTVYLQLPFNLVGFAFDQQSKRSDIF